ncbi:hypothetical protein DY000_02064261 [Brassica cretica]|uniref:Uncharacterized protein n=1 Tax=Brassica cretica TaxID=69181 RepID=A0ABQ7B002_BRACR|nr:hypothetical protein DY000_02064261 [Brassica cretica]
MTDRYDCLPSNEISQTHALELSSRRGVVRDCVSKHLYSSAIFFADKVAALTNDIYLQAQALFLAAKCLEWDQCLLMLGDAKVDEDGNVYDAKDGNLIYFDKDGEDCEINISSAICFLRGKAYGALQNRIKLLSRLIRCAMRRWNALLKVICSHLKKYDKESTVEARFKKLENEISGCVSGSSMISTLVNNTDLLACKAEYYHQCCQYQKCFELTSR